MAKEIAKPIRQTVPETTWSRDIIKAIAMDIGKEIVAYIEAMYPRPPYRLLEVLDVRGPVVGVDDPAMREIPRDVEHRDVTGPYPVTRHLVGVLADVEKILPGRAVQMGVRRVDRYRHLWDKSGLLVDFCKKCAVRSDLLDSGPVAVLRANPTVGDGDDALALGEFGGVHAEIVDLAIFFAVFAATILAVRRIK